MTDKPLESAQDAPEVQPEPQAEPSVPSRGQAPSPETLAEEDALVARLTKRMLAELKPTIEETASRKAQSVTDGTLAKYQKMATKLKEAGGDPVKAAREAAIDDLIGGGSPRDLVGTEPEEDEATAVMQAKTSIILDSAGIASDDPDYKKLVARYQGRIKDPDAWADVLQTFVGNRKKQEAVPNPAAAITGPGRPASGKTQEQEITDISARLEELQKTPSANATERAKLKARLRELQPPQKLGIPY